MIDDHALFAFYHERIPEHVNDIRTFESWRAEAETTDSELLFLRLDEVVRKDVDVSSASQRRS